MSDANGNLKQLLSQLGTAHFQSYLRSHGWIETPSRYSDQLRYEGNINGGDAVYELYLPASADVGKYQTRLLRSIYKLCGIEDREPADIVREMVVRYEEVKSPAVGSDATRLRLLNSGTKPMQITVDSPKREHTLYAHEAIELMCGCTADQTLEIAHGEGGLVIRTLPRH